MADAPTFQIPKDVIEPIIQANIAAAVAAALSGREKIVEAAIHQVLNQKVDDKGAPTTYSHYNTTFVQWLMNNAIREAAKDAVRAAISGQHEAIKTALAAELRKSASPIAKQIIAGVIGVAVTPHMLDYRLSVEVKAKER